MPEDNKYDKVRRRIWAAATGAARDYAGGDMEADFEEFHHPLSRINNASISGSGVVRGLSVSGELGAGSLKVEAGVAIDSMGRVVVLSSAPSSFGWIGEEPDGRGGTRPAVAKTVPVEVPLQPSVGPMCVTIHFHEAVVDDGMPAGLDYKESQPWIRLQPASGYDGSAIVLALVEVDANGRLASLSLGDTVHKRRVISEAVGGITILRPTEVGPVLSQAEAGAIRAEAGGRGLEIDIPAGLLLIDGNLEVAGIVNAPTVKISGRDMATEIQALTTSIESLRTHAASQSNPHGINCQQIGALPNTGGTLNGGLVVVGELTTTGTVNGRDVSSDGGKLDHAIQEIERLSALIDGSLTQIVPWRTRTGTYNADERFFLTHRVQPIDDAERMILSFNRERHIRIWYESFSVVWQWSPDNPRFDQLSVDLEVFPGPFIVRVPRGQMREFSAQRVMIMKQQPEHSTTGWTPGRGTPGVFLVKGRYVLLD